MFNGMRRLLTRGIGLSLLLLTVVGCRPPSDLGGALDLAMTPDDLSTVVSDLAGAKDLATNSDLAMQWPAPMPAPMSCWQRKAGVTAIQVVLQIDEYRGLQTGRNGTHEIAEGTVVNTPWVYDKTLVDTANIHLAMNVQDAMDPHGLPMELPLTVGQRIEVEGEYIPKATAGASNKKGAAAVIHFTHNPCGYAVIAGQTYR